MAIYISILAQVITGCTSIDQPPCYKGTVVNDRDKEPYDCTYVVKIEGGKIGETWRGIKNCVHIINLPEEAEKKGAVIFFSDFDESGGIICNALGAAPPKSIEIINYSFEKCIENEKD